MSMKWYFHIMEGMSTPIPNVREEYITCFHSAHLHGTKLWHTHLRTRGSIVDNCFHLEIVERATALRTTDAYWL